MKIYLNSGKVKKEWTDYNGHMNLAFYIHLFDAGWEVLLQKFNMGETSAKTEKKTTFAVESHTTYDREVKEGDELDINLFLNTFLEIQTTFLDDNELNVCLLKEPFVINKLKIMEPQNIEIANSTEIFFVPGLAFSKSGVRLGRGMGLYDRLLAKYPNSIKVGICSSVNLYDKLPQESHDILMDYVLTENENLKIH